MSPFGLYLGPERIHTKRITDLKEQRLETIWSLGTKFQSQRLTPTNHGPVHQSLSFWTQLPVNKMKVGSSFNLLLSSKVSQGDLFFFMYMSVSGIYEQKVIDLIFIFKHDLWTRASNDNSIVILLKRDERTF